MLPKDKLAGGDSGDHFAAPAAEPTESLAPLYSLILFGPPGTAKTTICQSLANKLGYNFLAIDTADFLASGTSMVASRMTYIFDRLRALERTIILFDEIEEFCLDRENPVRPSIYPSIYLSIYLSIHLSIYL